MLQNIISTSNVNQNNCVIFQKLVVKNFMIYKNFLILTISGQSFAILLKFFFKWFMEVNGLKRGSEI